MTQSSLAPAVPAAVVMLLVCLMGCAKQQQPIQSQPIANDRITPAAAAISEMERRTDWNMKFAELANAAADRMDECQKEIFDNYYRYGLRSHPLGGGPVCRDACKKYEVLLAYEHQSEPDFARLGKPYTKLPGRDICKGEEAAHD